MMVEEMLHPKNIVTRRGSIGQLYRPGSSEKSRPSTPEMRMSKRLTEAAEEAAQLAQQAREYTYLMQILTMRKKQGGKMFTIITISMFKTLQILDTYCCRNGGLQLPYITYHRNGRAYSRCHLKFCRCIMHFYICSIKKYTLSFRHTFPHLLHSATHQHYA